MEQGGTGPFRSAVLLTLLLCTWPGFAQAPYRSPYRTQYAFERKALIGDLESPPRGDTRLSGVVPYEEWYGGSTRVKFGAWGPRARHYPAPEGAAQWSLEFKRERVLATALLFEGLSYQHHHLPGFDPPTGWPWKPTSAGRNGPGVDCSNLVSFVYDLGLGIQPETNIHRLAVQETFSGPDDEQVVGQTLSLPKDYDALCGLLVTGDLLFIKGHDGGVSHVVLWAGKAGVSPDGVPLVLDSTSQVREDSLGHEIPPGIHLRPFRKDASRTNPRISPGFDPAWYFHNASHAVRILR
jgi:hypothetical protein